MTRALSLPGPLHKGLGYTVEWQGVEKGTGGHAGGGEGVGSKVVPKGLCTPGEGPELGFLA